MDPILDGLRKAGLSIPRTTTRPTRRGGSSRSHQEQNRQKRGERSLVPGFTFGLDRRDCSRCRRGRLVACSSSKQASCRFVSVSASRAVPVANQKSIAVLPFVNLSADKNDEYLSDGMTEELLNVLTKSKACASPDAVQPLLSKGRPRTTFFAKSGSSCM